MIWLISFFTLLGLNFTVWAIIGLIRYHIDNNKLPKIKKRYELEPCHFRYWVFLFINLMGVKLIINSIYTQFYSFKKILKNFLKANYIFPNFLMARARELIKNSHASLPNFLLNTPVKPEQVAAIIPAHNEELTIAKTIIALKRIMPAGHIHVGSDASTDKTAAIAKSLGAHVVDIRPNKGKAGVLTYLLEYFQLLYRYQAIIIVDADSEVDEHYLERALPLFDDPEVVAVAPHVKTKWIKHFIPRWSMFYTAYRVRLYRLLQAVQRYGQTWKYTNVSTIIPGFACMYRTSALKHININAPGLVIEDYNMTFEVHHQRLGRIAYSPRIFSYSQDPMNLKDYAAQVKRWNLGFWQTVRRHGFWASFFWLSMGIFMMEMLFYGFFFLVVPFFIFWFLAASFAPLPLPFTIPLWEISELRFIDFLVGIFLIDYIITIIVAWIEKKPILLWYGLGFILLRYLDAFMLLYTLPLAFWVKSDGRWVSPKRQAIAD